MTFADGEADYLYLSDGTKLAALKDGSGLIYCGSMVFSCSFSGTAPAVDFESTGFSAGRMVKKDGAVQPEYHVKDYLCSVRVVTDARGEVLERNDYSGYGKRLASSTGSANRYRFSGKEEQAFAGLAWQDFGARMYDPDLARWTAPDPLAEKYPGISPYVYCNDNPVNIVDTDGRDTVYVFDTPKRPLDRGVSGETYTAEAYVEIDGMINGPYRSSSYPNSKSSTDNSPGANTVNEGVMIDFNNKYGHKGGSRYGLNLVNESGQRKVGGTSPDGNYVEMTLVNVHSGYSDKGNYNSRGSDGCITIHPDDAADFFSNFTWNTGKFTGSSFGKIIIFRKNNQNRDVQYNRILKHLKQ